MSDNCVKPMSEQTMPVGFEISGDKWHLPMRLFKPHEDQALRNHEQNLDKLAQRGGLSPQEAVAILTDQPWRSVYKMTLTEAMNKLACIYAAESSR